MKTIQTKVDAILTATQPSANSPPTWGECRPAFPSTTEHGFNCGESGMTLRDYFAAKAMQGMAGSHAYCERGWDQADLAGQAYEIADAMLKARNRGVEQSENDRRAAACLNALKHVSTEDLESGQVQSISLRLFEAEKQRDELRDVLKSCIEYVAAAGDDWVTDKAREIIAKSEATLAAVQPATNDWIPWAGGNRPVDTIVVVKFRSGGIGTDHACSYDWRHVNGPVDIVAYQVAQQSEETGG